MRYVYSIMYGKLLLILPKTIPEEFQGDLSFGKHISLLCQPMLDKKYSKHTSGRQLLNGLVNKLKSTEWK